MNPFRCFDLYLYYRSAAEDDEQAVEMLQSLER